MEWGSKVEMSTFTVYSESCARRLLWPFLCYLYSILVKFSAWDDRFNENVHNSVTVTCCLHVVPFHLQIVFLRPVIFKLPLLLFEQCATITLHSFYDVYMTFSYSDDISYDKFRPVLKWNENNAQIKMHTFLFRGYMSLWLLERYSQSDRSACIVSAELESRTQFGIHDTRADLQYLEAMTWSRREYARAPATPIL